MNHNLLDVGVRYRGVFRVNGITIDGWYVRDIFGGYSIIERRTLTVQSSGTAGAEALVTQVSELILREL